MTLIEFFDPANVAHLRAWRALQTTGQWPKGFWSELEARGVSVPLHWQYAVTAKIADHYIDAMLGPVACDSCGS